MAGKKKPFRGLRALISALAEGAMSKEEITQALDAVQMGIGMSKRDKALGEALENTGEDKDNPVFWGGFRLGLFEGYEGARREYAEGGTLRPIAELAAEAEAESKAELPDFGDRPYDPTAPVNIAAHEKAKRERTGCYAPGASDDPNKVSTEN